MVFDVLVFGEFPAALLCAKYTDTPRSTTPELESMIGLEWERRLAEAQRAGRVLFNGELLRYVRHDVVLLPAGAALELTVGPTCYRDFAGTNLFNHHRLSEFGWERFSNPIGTTATLVTSDDQIVYGRRSERVAYHAGYVHTFGGALEAQDRQPDGRIDPFASVLRELKEELGLAATDLDDLVCVGLARDREIIQPELLFEGRLRLSYVEVCSRWRDAESRDEHAELVRLDDRAAAIQPFIERCSPIAPVAVAGLYLHGRRRWGEDWFRAICK